MKLPDPLGQARRTRLQDVGRLHFEDMVRARWRMSPHPGLGDAAPADLAAPRREDDVGIAPQDLARIDDAIARQASRPGAPGKTGRHRRSRSSSSTQRMPEISGSSHSSKNTRGGVAEARRRFPDSQVDLEAGRRVSRRWPSVRRDRPPSGSSEESRPTLR